jgi:hypothetical protein
MGQTVARPDLAKQACPNDGKGIRAVLALAFLSAMYLFFTQSARSNYPDHGDRASDAWAILAARNLNQFGFRNLMFFGTNDEGPAVGLPPCIACHHPSFPVVVLGFAYRLGLATTTARLAPLLFTQTALLAMFLMGRAVTKDWLVGLVAAVAMAVAAPFRFEADSLVYISYDMPLKVWCLAFLVFACQSMGRHKAAWLVAATLGAFVTISCSGFEMVPAIAVFAVFAPVILIDGVWRQRCGAAVLFGSCIATGFAAGMLVRIVHNSYAMGSVSAVFSDYRASLLFRSLPAAHDLFWNRTWPTEMAHRIVAYYPVQLIFLACGGLIVGALMLLRSQQPDWRLMRIVALIVCCDVVYGLFLRQHVWIHTHTITHLCTSLSLMAGLLAVALWRAFQGLPGRIAAVGATCVVAMACVSNVGVKSYGNNEAYSNPEYYIRIMSALTRDVPADAVVECGQPMGPTPLMFLNRSFLWRTPIDEIELHGRPLYYMTAKFMPASDAPYPEGRFEKEKVAAFEEFEIFRLVPRRQPTSAAVDLR